MKTFINFAEEGPTVDAAAIVAVSRVFQTPGGWGFHVHLQQGERLRADFVERENCVAARRELVQAWTSSQ